MADVAAETDGVFAPDARPVICKLEDLLAFQQRSFLRLIAGPVLVRRVEQAFAALIDPEPI